jgi:serine-type D-Ala-D-Ala carboxypeptidase (penicillin-binding protein 5/6)
LESSGRFGILRNEVTVRYTVLVLFVLIVSAAVIVRAYDVTGSDSHGSAVGSAEARASSEPKPPPPYATAPDAVRLRLRFKHPPAAGMLFDVTSGRVLWTRGAYARRHIASLAKMMTAIVVDDRARYSERVRITPEAKSEPGSAVGLLAPGRLVPLRLLMYGLMLPSGNDAAVALAQHVGGTVDGFVDDMNVEAKSLGLRCSHFSSPDGYEDAGNLSCPRDLAVLAHEVLKRPRLAKIVSTRYISFLSLLPHTAKVRGKQITVWKPGRLYLAGHNPLMRSGYPGVTGIKTGYTDAAGLCFVGTARHGRHHLGVVLLHSPDPAGQARRILDRGFRALALRP